MDATPPTDRTPADRSRPHEPRGRALVLAGGGAAGNAWELGLVTGLAEAGVDVTTAEVIIGTSAGSTVAAQITSGTSPADLYAAVLAEVPPPRPHGGPAGASAGPAGSSAGPPGSSAARPGPDGGPPGPGAGRPRAAVSGQAYLNWSDAVIAGARDAADMRRAMGAAALAREAAQDAGPSRWREVVASRLTNPVWPQQRVLVTAVDARTGEPVVFDRDSGVDLVDAVAASTSAMVPHHIGADRYLNGGYRRSENADLAAGYERVLVFSPFGGRTRMPLAWGMDLATQVEELRAAGSRVECVFPDAGAGEVFDANALDPSTRLQAARGGHAQGLALAASLADLWSVPA